MHIKLDLVLLHALVQAHRRIQQLLPDVSQPRDIPLFQIAHAPDIPPLHQPQQMQTPHRLPIPIQIRQQQEPVLLPRLPVNDVFLLGAPLDDVEDPVQRAFGALRGDPRSNVGGVDGGGLGNDAEGLGGVFFDVFGGARVDQVQFVVWGLGGGGGRRGGVGEEPGVDVVCAEVFDVGEGGGKGGEVSVAKCGIWSAALSL